MQDYRKIADLLYPNINKDTSYWEERYTPRNLGNAEVTRFAPSPTGYMHIGHFFGANLDYRIAKSTPNGIFFFRLEDTDKKREIEGSDIVALKTLAYYGIVPDEGFTIDRTDNGNYGPYRQSDRTEIYQTYAKKLVAEGKAFPCFCAKPEGKQEVLEKRELQLQEDNQVEEKDPCRDLTAEEVEANLRAGKTFCIRLRSNGKPGEKVKVIDVVRGERELGANCKDVVLVKDNGIPPYAFAHAIDDHLMGTTTVVRGEEWISTWPQHVEIFKALGFEPLKYLHTPVLCKIDNGNKRKISKSKDPEADMRYYIKAGLPQCAVTEYLLNIMNSNFEDWREQNPDKDVNEFPFDVKKVGTSSPFFDIVKLEDVSKKLISHFTASEVYDNVVAWAKEFNEKWYELLTNDQDYAVSMFNIDRNIAKPRKDIVKWSDIPTLYSYFYDSECELNTREDYMLENILACAKDILNEYLTIYNVEDSKEDWFNKIKELGAKYGFAKEVKEYKKDPTAYIGHCGDVCTLIRVALTGRTQTPDLYEILKLFGVNRIRARFERFYKVI